MTKLKARLRAAQRQPKPVAPPVEDDSSSSESDIPAEPQIPRGLALGPATRHRASVGRMERSLRATAASSTTSRVKRKLGDEAPSPRSTKRTRTPHSNGSAVSGISHDQEQSQDEDDEAAVDSTVLGMFDSFAKSRGHPQKPAQEVMVVLHSSRDNRVRTRSASRRGMPLRSELGTIDGSPRSNGSNLVASNAKHLPLEAREEEEDGDEDVEYQVETEGGEDDDDASDELFVPPTPSNPRTASPELHTATPHHQPPRPPKGMHDFPDDAREREVRLSGVTSTQRITINGLSTANRDKIRPPLTSEAPLLSIEESDIGYPVAAPNSSRAGRSKAVAPPPRPSSSRAPVLTGSRVSTQGGAGTSSRPLRATLGFIGEEVEEDEEGDEDEADHEHEQQDEANPPASSAASPRLTVTVSSHAIKAMYKLMGKFGWTNKGDDWHKKLRAGLEANDAPGVTRMGEQLFKYLFQLKSTLGRAPTAPQLDRQNKWFEEHDSSIKKTCSEIGKLITKIREDRLAALGDSDRRDNAKLELRRAMVSDLTRYVVPMLVQTLWTGCSLGGIRRDEGNIELAENPIFTATSLQYARKVTNWVYRLQEALAYEIEQRPPSYSDAKKADIANKNYSRFATTVETWGEEVQDAQDDLQEQVDRQERIVECKESDQAIREAREREEEEELERKQQKWEEVAQSTKWIASQPRPLQEMWRRATGDRRSLSSSSSGFSAGIKQARPVQFNEPPVVAEHDPWPNEDKKWLLDELRRQDRKRGPMNQPPREEIETWAETLGRDVDEVVQEMELLKQAARHIALQKGVMVEAWAAARL